jgi:nitrite reductase/ring-hydroxylating ferredoxin subunit
MDSGSRIVDASAVPDDSTFLFIVREGFDEKEALLVRLDGEVAAWRDYCPPTGPTCVSTRAAARSSATAA